MFLRSALMALVVFGWAFCCIAQEKPQPIELEVLKASVGVWDAEIEVWPAGPDSPSITFKGVETVRPYGEYWIASDFDSEYQGETIKVHSIVGYDLEQNKLVGTTIDHGPYSAKMVGEYDKESKTVHWLTYAKHLDGKPLVQKTSITQKAADQRVLVLNMPGEKEGEFVEFMRIRFLKRK